jgi:hypothetical protein
MVQLVLILWLMPWPPPQVLLLALLLLAVPMQGHLGPTPDVGASEQQPLLVQMLVQVQ